MPTDEHFRAIANEHEMHPAVLYRGPTVQPTAVMVECFAEDEGQVRLTMANPTEPFEMQLVISRTGLEDLIRDPKPHTEA